MKTVFVKKSDALDKKALEKAASIIKGGGLVAFPTETVYGLGASAYSGEGAEKIYLAKGRPCDNPLIVHIADARDAEEFAYTSDIYYKITDEFSPGPITVILPKKPVIPDRVTGGLQTVAVRIPSHPVARAFIRAAGVPIAAPSANISGRPSPTRAEHVLEDLDGRVDMIIDGGDCEFGLESTIVRISDSGAVILRPGAVTEEMLSRVTRVSVTDGMFRRPEENEKPEAPGMKYTHYAPKAPVYMVRGGREDTVEFFNSLLAKDPNTGIIAFEEDKDRVRGKNVKYIRSDPESQGKRLFAVLRSFNKTDAGVIYSVIPSSRGGMGLAVMNRMTKAAGFKTVKAAPTPYIIGITGQTGAGKGEVCRVLEKQGIPTLDCDRVYAELIAPPSALLDRIGAEFGTEAINEDGTLNRGRLSSIVFSEGEKLKILNSITHGAVLDEVRLRLKALYEKGAVIAAVDAPQLFEAGFDRECDTVVAVLAPEGDRLKRITARDNITEENAFLRMQNQHGEDFFLSHCDRVLKNDSTLEELEKSVCEAVLQIKKEAGFELCG